MRLQELAALLGPELTGQAGCSGETLDLEITGVASLQEARAGDVTFFSNPRYLAKLRETKASVVIVPKDFSEQVPPLLLRAENPSEAFAKVIAAFTRPEPPAEPGIHPTASVSPSAVIGADVSIGPLAVVADGVTIGDGSVIGAGCLIGRGVVLGKRCRLHPGVIIREHCLLGDRVILQPGVVIGSCGFGYEFHEGQHRKIPQTGIVEIGDDVEVGANSTVDRARFGRTVIGEGTKIDNLVQIAHNVCIGPHSIICAQVGVSGSTRIGSHVTLAGQVGLAGHLEIGDRAVLAAKSGVSKNVPAGSVLAGAPAKTLKEFKQMNFYISQLHKLFDRVKELESRLERSSSDPL